MNSVILDSNGNTFLHVMVMKDKIEMFLYACNHPKIKAKLNNKNAQGLTPFNLAAKLGRLEMFNKIININVKVSFMMNMTTSSLVEYSSFLLII